MKGKRLGIGHGLPALETGSMDQCGEHTSNPLAGPADTFPFWRWGGNLLGDGKRSDVHHFGVDRQPMIAHPFPDVQPEE